MALQSVHLLSAPNVLLLIVSSVLLWNLCRSLWHAIYNVFLSPLNKFPGPRLAALTKFWEIYHVIKCDRFLVIHELHKKYGNVVRIGPNEVSIASPKVFHHVFVTKCSSFVKSDFYANIQPGIGPKYSGLFNYVDHARAMAERRDVQPMFSPAMIKVYEKRYDKQLEQLVSVMKQRKEIDLFTYLKYLLLDVVGDLAFDQSFNQLESGEEHQYVIDFNNAFMLIGLVCEPNRKPRCKRACLFELTHIQQNVFAPIIPLIPYLPFQSLKNAYDGLQRVFAYSQARVADYLKLNKEQKEGTLISGYLDLKTGNPKEGYSPWSIALAGHGFIIAGSEATTITLTYVVWLLIKHPRVEQKLRQELCTVPKNYSSSDLAVLPYLDAVIKETLRVYPPAPSPMPRVVPSQGFSMDGVVYPPKTVISAQPYTLHRWTEVFDQPDTFNPDRWLGVPATTKEEMHRAFVPFSAGQRGCIGRGLAWMHMMKAVAKLLEEFDRFEVREDMTDDDMVLIERGALAKPKSTKLWVRCIPKPEAGFQHVDGN
ncbi:hypothetical protein LTS15_009690 [Exophiala xenobiotica]|nr:hypothetical protein LTS15_009690 [Exophiala xenobiotica]